jgi:hypothetical protein
MNLLAFAMMILAPSLVVPCRTRIARGRGHASGAKVHEYAELSQANLPSFRHFPEFRDTLVRLSSN